MGTDMWVWNANLTELQGIKKGNTKRPEIHAAETPLPEPSFNGVEIANEKFKHYKLI
jgi:hypothetical protein